MLTTDTPQSVITALQDAYEEMNLSRFTRLIYDPEDFNSYIYVPPRSSISFPHGAELIPDTIIFDEAVPQDLQFIPLTYSEEKKIHEEIFTRAEKISFSRSMSIISVDYYNENSEKTQSRTDFDYIVTKTGDAEIVVELPSEKITFDIEGQYFLLKKDNKDNLRIWKWIEHNG
ncbi:MAG: hypothetical protein ACQEQ4_04810 [Fibrobacterota bacterium]